MTKPRQMKAPGGRMKIKMLAVSGRMLRPKMEPLPRNSRMQPNSVKARVKPKPMPRPSNMDGNTGFFEAKASARPSTMQFTTIKGMNKPRVS